jgi:hypothetical protein
MKQLTISTSESKGEVVVRLDGKEVARYTVTDRTRQLAESAGYRKVEAFIADAIQGTLT